jgi:hypothetical protein
MTPDDVMTWKRLKKELHICVDEEQKVRSLISSSSDDLENRCERLIKLHRAAERKKSELECFINEHIITLDPKQFVYTEIHHDKSSQYIAFTTKDAAQEYYGEDICHFEPDTLWIRIEELVQKRHESKIERLIKSMNTDSKEMQIDILGKPVENDAEWEEYSIKISLIKNFIEKHLRSK